MSNSESLSTSLGRGLAAGLVGTGVMTAFQRFVEMPLTHREESYAPAELAMKLLPLEPKDAAARRRVNYVAHFVLGAGWGVARGAVGRTGLRGPRAVLAVFGAMYSADAVTATTLGVYRPTEWSALDVAVDVVDKLVLAVAASVAYEVLESRAAG